MSTFTAKLSVWYGCVFICYSVLLIRGAVVLQREANLLIKSLASWSVDEAATTF